MGKVSKFLIQASALLLLLGLASVREAKADTLTFAGTDPGCTTSSVACWTNVEIFGNGNGNLNNTYDTVEFFTNPTNNPTQLSVLITCTSGCDVGGTGVSANRAGLYGVQAFTGTTTAPTVSTDYITFNDNPDDYLGVGPYGENGPGTAGYGNVNDIFSLTSTTTGNIHIQAASLSFDFVLPTSDTPPTDTPEPSSLAMLGSGLMGLVGFGWRRIRA